MRSIPLYFLPAAALFPVCTFAQEQEQEPQPQALREEPGVLDVAMTPLSDLNIKSDQIPELLLRAQEEPYGLAGLDDCSALNSELGQFNSLLGDDFDLPRNLPGRTSVGAIGQAAIGSFIPFRGLVREVSGAKGRERALSVAVQAGYARRGFLKGVGYSKGCAYPARPASENDIVRIENEREAALGTATED